MKILGIRLARSVWVMPSHFLNPKGIDTRPVLASLKERYAFQSTPLDYKSREPSEGQKFENGIFKVKKNSIQIVNLAIHDDGIVIDTRSSTEDADAFMEDAIDWVNKNFGLPALAELPVKRFYVSEINVAFDSELKIIDPRLSSLISDVSDAIGDDVKGPVRFFSLNLGTDQTRSKNPAIFRIDREINTAHEENRYWCSAPIHTHVHIRLLEKLEKLSISK